MGRGEVPLQTSPQSQERLEEDASVVYSRGGRINNLLNPGVWVTRDRFGLKKFHGLLCSKDIVIAGTKSSVQEKSQVSNRVDRLNG